ncbi:LysM peptidoglycan-binding domain-containing protein [Pseudomonas sp. NCHU5208]|uniref:LysM peptidoglycan-binding domain-containing protein n=1 Tax=unclassified Pseudomonas TaxID=196821 RepID=UPI003F9DBE4B
MELTSYSVKSGDTLSQIATAHQTDIATLKRLNPFIRDANHIQAGWNLSVPKADNVSVAVDASQPAAPASSVQPEKVKCEPVLELGPPPSPLCTTSECFAPADPPPCSQRYANILYATDEQEFWLLPERVVSAIKEAEHLLNQRITPAKSPDERLRGLDESGLLEYFLEPRLSSFLEGEEKARLEEIETYDPDLEANADEAEAFREAMRHMSPIDQIDQTDYDRQQLAEGERLIQLRDEKRQLESKAKAIAQGKGYILEKGMLFTPEAIEARDAVQRYLNARKTLLESTDGKLPENYQKELADFVAESARRYNEAMDCRTNCLAPFASYVSWRNTQEKKLGEKREYLESIIEAAQYGIALPEFALVGGDYPADASQTDLSGGVGLLQQYLNLEKQQLEVHTRLRDKYRAWLKATGENAPAPAGLVDAERAAWERIQSEKDKLRLQAEQNVASTYPRRHLLWHPEEFQPKPLERLVKSNFPLREVSFSDTKGLLSHFSLHNINKALKEDAVKVVKDSVKNLRNKIPQKSGSVAASARSDFGNWLMEQGAFVIDDQHGDWFDSQGWFDVEIFHQYLQRDKIEVDTLEDAATRQAWGERLRQILFKEEVRSALRLFDRSPQAQLVRCLTPPQASVHGAVSIVAPTLSMADGFSAGVRATLDIDLARGEVELLKVDLPERAKAKDLTFTYLDHADQKQTMSLGRFSIYLGVKAWGYAGASLMLAGTLRLGPNKSAYDLIGPPRPARRSIIQRTEVTEDRLPGRAADARMDDGLSAQFVAFAGVQAGIKIDGSLNWAPPAALAVLRTIPAGNDADTLATENNQWLPLARLTANLSGAVGIGAKGDVTLSLMNGRFVLRIKAALIAGPGVDGMFTFEVGYESVEQLINLFRRELHKNQGKPLNWVSADAAERMSVFNLLGSAGLSVSMLYLMEVDMVMSLYEVLTSGGKGGPIAYTIMTYRKPEELEQWFVEATPAALGPMLMTLIDTPKAFKIVSSTTDPRTGRPQEQAEEFTAVQAHLFQQQAIERVLGWILRGAQSNGTLADAQRQFEDACISMNRFGTKSATPGQTYCDNRVRLDHFMAERVEALVKTNNDMRARYQHHVAALGAQQDGYCVRYNHSGRNRRPGGLADYVGPGE